MDFHDMFNYDWDNKENSHPLNNEKNSSYEKINFNYNDITCFRNRLFKRSKIIKK